MKERIKELIVILALSATACVLMQAAMIAFIAPEHLKQAIIESITQ